MIALITVLVAGLFWFWPEQKNQSAPARSLAEALSTDIEGYDRAWHPRPLRFPQDHGPHNDFKLEWWYLTGNLEDAAGNRYGYQVTIFRNALAPPVGDSLGSERHGDWATRQLYLAHVAFTDAAKNAYRSEERFVRGAAGLAGAESSPFRVWAGPVEIRGDPATGLERLRVTAPIGDGTLDLTLTARKPIVLQGDDGFSPKGNEPGNASFYYSLTRFEAEGSWQTRDARVALSGSSWLDREWSTSLLGKTQTGWDWFSIQLDDGRDIMYFRLREDDPAALPYTDGVVVYEDGATRSLDADDVTLSVENTWTSPLSGATYPTGWRLEIPAENIDIGLTALMDNQEFNASIRYWEGAVRASGSHSGYGYIELTGYDK